MKVSTIIKSLYIFNLIQQSLSGPITSGACMYACNMGAVACYASLGFIFGTVSAGVGTPAGIIACNTAQGACMAGCAALVISPTP